jgi:hypothetical protein
LSPPVDPARPAVTLTFALKLAAAVSEALARSLTDPELGDFAVIQRGTGEANVDQTIMPGRSEIKISITLPTEDFPLESALT